MTPEELEKLLAGQPTAAQPAAPVAQPVVPAVPATPRVAKTTEADTAPRTKPVTLETKGVKAKAPKIEAPAAPEPVVPPDVQADITEDLKKFHRLSQGVDSHVAAAQSLGPDFERKARAQAVDLKVMFEKAQQGRTFEEVARANRERSVLGFVPPAEREAEWKATVERFNKAEAGDAGDEIKLKASGADKPTLAGRAGGAVAGGMMGAAAGPVGAAAGAVAGATSMGEGYFAQGTQEALPEVTKPGEYGYQIAETLVRALSQDKEASSLYDRYGRKQQGGATIGYIQDRVEQLAKKRGLSAADPQFDEKLKSIRRQATNELIAYKTIGLWTPVILAKDVAVMEGLKAPGFLEAMAPNIELVGFDNKNQAIFRQESALSTIFRAIDIPQEVLVGARNAMPEEFKVENMTPGEALLALSTGGTTAIPRLARGVAKIEPGKVWDSAKSGVMTGANVVEATLEATEDAPTPVRVAAGLAGFAATMAFPDMLGAAAKAAPATARALLKSRDVGRTQKALKLLREAQTAYGEASALPGAARAAKLREAGAAEAKLRDQFLEVADVVDRNDAAAAERITVIDPEIPILDARFVDQVNAVLGESKTAAGKSVLHPSYRSEKLTKRQGGTETTSLTYPEKFDYADHLERAEADAAAIRSVQTGAPDQRLVRHFETQVDEVMDEAFGASLKQGGPGSITQAEYDAITAVLKQQLPAFYADPKNWQRALQAAFAANPATASLPTTMRQGVYRSVAPRMTRRFDRTMDLADKLEAAAKANLDARGLAHEYTATQMAMALKEAYGPKVKVTPPNLYTDVALKSVVTGKPVDLSELGKAYLILLRRAQPTAKFEDLYAQAIAADVAAHTWAEGTTADPFRYFETAEARFPRGGAGPEFKAGGKPPPAPTAPTAPTAPATPPTTPVAPVVPTPTPTPRPVPVPPPAAVTPPAPVAPVPPPAAVTPPAPAAPPAVKPVAPPVPTPAVAPPVPAAPTLTDAAEARIAKLEDEIDLAIENDDMGRVGELEMEIENIRQGAPVEAPEAPKAAPAPAPTPAPVAAPVPDRYAGIERAMRRQDLSKRLREMPEALRRFKGHEQLSLALASGKLSPEQIDALRALDNGGMLRLINAMNTSGTTVEKALKSLEEVAAAPVAAPKAAEAAPAIEVKEPYKLAASTDRPAEVRRPLGFAGDSGTRAKQRVPVGPAQGYFKTSREYPYIQIRAEVVRSRATVGGELKDGFSYAMRGDALRGPVDHIMENSGYNNLVFATAEEAHVAALRELQNWLDKAAYRFPNMAEEVGLDWGKLRASVRDDLERLPNYKFDNSGPYEKTPRELAFSDDLPPLTADDLSVRPTVVKTAQDTARELLAQGKSQKAVVEATGLKQAEVKKLAAAVKAEARRAPEAAAAAPTPAEFVAARERGETPEFPNLPATKAELQGAATAVKTFDWERLSAELGQNGVDPRNITVEQFRELAAAAGMSDVKIKELSAEAAQIIAERGNLDSSTALDLVRKDKTLNTAFYHDYEDRALALMRVEEELPPERMEAIRAARDEEAASQSAEATMKRVALEDAAIAEVTKAGPKPAPWAEGKRPNGPLEPAEKDLEDTLGKFLHEQEDPWNNPFVPPEKMTRASDAAKTEPVLPLAEARTKVEGWKAEAARQGKEGKNRGKVVLSLFDASGEWSRPWREAGYDVYTFDIQSGEDISKFSAQYFAENYTNIDNVYAILAAPPCTHFTVTGARWWAGKDAAGVSRVGTKMVDQTLATIEYFKPAVWALENPRGRIAKLTGLPTPRLKLDPSNYGAPYTKETYLWGDFNPELPQANVEPTEGSRIHKLGGKDKFERSLTPEGFAYAFFMANNAEALGDAKVIAREMRGVPEDLVQKAIDAGHEPDDIREAIADAFFLEQSPDEIAAILEDMIANPVAKAEPVVEAPKAPEVEVAPAAPTTAVPADIEETVATHRAVEQELKGVDTLDGAVRHIGQRTTNPYYKRLADRLVENGALESVGFEFTSPLEASIMGAGIPSGASGIYVPASNKVRIRSSQLLEGQMIRRPFPVEEVILHEAVHAATTNRLTTAKRLPAGHPLRKSRDDLETLYRQALAFRTKRRSLPDVSEFEKGERIEKQMKNLDEFVAHGMASPEFQGWLKTMKLKGAETVWDKFVSSVASLLGLRKEDNTALARLIDRTDELMRQPAAELVSEAKTWENRLELMRHTMWKKAEASIYEEAAKRGIPIERAKGRAYAFAKAESQAALEKARKESKLPDWFTPELEEAAAAEQAARRAELRPEPTRFRSLRRDVASTPAGQARQQRKADLMLARLRGESDPMWEDVPKNFVVDERRRLAKADEDLVQGRISRSAYDKRIGAVGDDLERKAALKEARARRPLVRGAARVRSHLLDAVSKGILDERAVDMVDWFIQQNPRVADDLVVHYETPKAGVERGLMPSTAGEYTPALRLVKLFTDAVEDDTAVHEVLHHAERMLPEDLQAAVSKEWRKRLVDQLKKAETPEHRAVLGAMLTGDKAKVEAAFANRTVPYEFYQFVNPSEFWAVNASRIVSGRYAAFNAGMVQKAKRWLSEFIQKAKSVFGLQSDAPIIRGLDAVMKGDGTFVSNRMLADTGKSPLEAGYRAISAQAPAAGDIEAAAPGITELRRAMLEAAGDETAFDPKAYAERKDVCKLTGHCNAAAYIVQKKYGGELLSAKVQGETHVWNRLPDGTQVDLTGSQYGGDGFRPVAPSGKVVPPRATVNPRFKKFEAEVTKAMQAPTPSGITEVVEAPATIAKVDEYGDLTVSRVTPEGRPDPGSYIKAELVDKDQFVGRLVDEITPSNEEAGRAAAPLDQLRLPAEKFAYVPWLETAETGKGIGRLLWEATTDELRRQGVRYVYTTATPNAAPFWARMGFVDDAWDAGQLKLMRADLESAPLRQVDPTTGQVKGELSTSQKTGRYVVTLFKNADPSTALHEMAHIIRRTHLNSDQMQAIVDYAQTQGVSVGHQFGEFTGAADDIEKAEELFAQAFERYVIDGVTPNPDLQAAFDRLQGPIAQIYQGIQSSPLGAQLAPAMSRVFDQVVATQKVAAPAQLPEVIYNQAQAARRAQTEGPLTAVSREANRLGLKAGFSVDDLAKKLKASLDANNGDPRLSKITFPPGAKVFGKNEWTAEELGQFGERLAQEASEAVMRAEGIGIDLSRRGGGVVIQEKAPVERIRSALTTRKGDTVGQATAKDVGRRFVGTFFGGDAIGEALETGGLGLRDVPVELRRDFNAATRNIEQGIGDTVSVLNDIAVHGNERELYDFLGGKNSVRLSNGRAVFSSGYDMAGAVNRMIGNVFQTLTQEKKEGLMILADAVNSRLPGKSLSQAGYNVPQAVIDAEADAIHRASIQAKEASLGRSLTAAERAALYRPLTNAEQAALRTREWEAAQEKMQKGADSFLKWQPPESGELPFMAAIRNALGFGDVVRPQQEYAAIESMLYVSGITPRNGAMFSGSSADASEILLRDLRRIYSSDSDAMQGEQVARQVAVLIGAYGQADRSKHLLAGLGLVVDKPTRDAFVDFLNKWQVPAGDRPRVEQMLARFGQDPRLVSDTILGADMYIPKIARDRIAQSLGKAVFVGQADNDVMSMTYRYIKTRMTRGSIVLRQRYFTANTVDHFLQMAVIAGYGPALQSVSRVMAQNLMVAPFWSQAVAIIQRTPVGKRLGPDVLEKIRVVLSKGGDRMAWAIGTMVSSAKYRIEVNPILEGVDGSFVVGDRVYSYKEIRNIAVEEGIFASFQTRELQNAILKEGQIIADANGVRQVGATKAGIFKANLEPLMEDVANIAEAWAERERIGAMVTLMEQGFDPRVAARLTIDALYDYSTTMTKADRNWIVSVIFPFWAFQKNANQAVFNLALSPEGAYRMMCIQRARQRGTELLTELLYNEVGDDYGVDVESMPPELQQSYYAIITKVEETYPDGAPLDVKMALRLLLSGRPSDIYGGKQTGLSQALLQSRALGDLDAFAPFAVPRPEKSALPSYLRDRPGIAVTPERNELTRFYYSLVGSNDHSYVELFLPETFIEAGMRHIAYVAASYIVLSSKVAGAAGLIPAESGIKEVNWFTTVQPILDVERSPLIGPILAEYTGGELSYPKRVYTPAAKAVESGSKVLGDGMAMVHPMLGKMIDDMFGAMFIRVPEVGDPIAAAVANGTDVREIAKERLDEIRALQEKYPDATQLRRERRYLPGGTWSTLFENSPVGELNAFLLRRETSEMEKLSFSTEMVGWARRNLGLDAVEISGSRTARAEEPTKLKSTKEM